MRDSSYGNIAEQRFGFLVWFSGCRDRPNRNFTTDVDEGKPRGHVRSKTPASRAVWIWTNLSGLSQFIGITSLTKSYICVKFIVSLDLLFAHCLFFKGAHETTSLSWFFCVKTKEQEKNKIKRIQTYKFISQHIKILFSRNIKIHSNTLCYTENGINFRIHKVSNSKFQGPNSNWDVESVLRFGTLVLGLFLMRDFIPLQV